MRKFEMLNIITENTELTMKEKMVAHYFIYKSNKEGICFPCVETIAKACGASVRTVQRATKRLVEIGILLITNRFIENKQTSNEYKLNFIAEVEKSKEEQIINMNNIEIIEFEELIQDRVEDNKSIEKEEILQDENNRNNIKCDKAKFKKFLHKYIIAKKQLLNCKKTEYIDAKSLDIGKEIYMNSNVDKKATATVGIKNIPINKFLSWKFCYKQAKDRVSILLMENEAEKFWKYYLSGDLYDRTVEYRDYLNKIRNS